MGFYKLLWNIQKWDSHSGVGERQISGTWPGKELPTGRRIFSLPPSVINQSFFLNCLELKDSGSDLPRYVYVYLPVHTASYDRRIGSDTTKLFRLSSWSSSSSSSSALQPWVGLGLLNQMSPASSILCIRPPLSTAQFHCVFLHPLIPPWFRSATSSVTSRLCPISFELIRFHPFAQYGPTTSAYWILLR